ncbi:iron uptake system protein EfeO [Brevibacillus massiliensis]|jgi:iron uptake system component EfeO|uniref:iron uptake system protein EfeO n=1 Tax=Brevibacillus massiliensis TaxID=1118054 RepID=UPI0002F74FC6|nr:iron uptake system protein EfeO [Brevibacillus massiliensis]
MKKTVAFTSMLLIVSAVLFGCGSQPADKAAPQPPQESKPAGGADVSEEMKSVTDSYRAYALEQIDQFVQATESFTDAVKNGDLEKAQALYAPTRMFYERIEPIAEALGDLDPDIDARENDVPDEEWRGFHRIEKGLWIDKTTKGYETYADQLINDAKLLRGKVETVEVTPQMLVTGAVELLNEVSSSKVTGEEERYSHTDLYDFAANVEGAEKIYELLKPAIEKKDSGLSQEIEKRFAEVDKLLASCKKGEGYVLYTELGEEQIKKLSQAIDNLAEPLSNMGIVLEG